MKHTPGPWTASDEPGAYDICVVEHEDWRKNWYVTVEGPKRAEPEPDARLIAAAPAMYEALEDALNTLKAVRHFLHDHERDSIEYAELALAAARGKT